MRRRKPIDDRTQAQGLALDDNEDDERRVETARAREEVARRARERERRQLEASRAQQQAAPRKTVPGVQISAAVRAAL